LAELRVVPLALLCHDPNFPCSHGLHATRGTSADRIRNKRVKERTGKEVDTSDIVKGYEVGEGEYVRVEPDS
ncbi:Ku protein, partial [Streptomyces sp. NPDC047453]|uniref:Ku protein n=1 Tax=Streptomyces sp. NPDC047453 TaxID=3154812 RepID=UPI0033CFD040